MARAFLSFTAETPAALAAAITATFSTLLNRSITRIDFQALDPVVGHHYRAIVTHDASSVTLTQPFQCQGFTQDSLGNLAKSAEDFVALHPADFVSPLITRTISSNIKPGEHAGLIFWTTDSTGGATNWTDGTFQVPLVAALGGTGTALGVGGTPWKTSSGTVLKSASDRADYRINVFEKGALGNGVADDTTAFQEAINQASSNGGGVVEICCTVSGYKIGNISIPAYVYVEGLGQVKLIDKPGSTGPMFLMGGPTQVTQFSGLKNIQTVCNPSNVERMFLHLNGKPVVADQYQGGVWYCRFDNIRATGFTSDCVWAQGGTASAAPGAPGGSLQPIQFIDFINCYFKSAASDRYALHHSGQCGQFEYIDCLFENTARAGPSVKINRYEDDTRTETGDDAYSYTINFRSGFFQDSDTAVWIRRGQSILLDGCYFEDNNSGVFAELSPGGVLVSSCIFFRSATNGGNGFAVKLGSYSFAGELPITIRNCQIESGDVGVWSVYTGGIDTTAFCSNNNATTKTLNLTRQIGVDSNIINTYSDHTVFVNTSADPIYDINSTISVGGSLFVTAWTGPLVFDSSGGTIGLGFGVSTFTLADRKTAHFVRIDTAGKWMLCGSTP